MKKHSAHSIKTAIAVIAIALTASAAGFALSGCAKQKVDNRASIKLTSAPDGASVFSGSQELGKTPFSMKAPPGVYILKFEKSGFKPSWEKLEAKPRETKNLDVELAPLTAAIMVKTVPSGAKVRYEGSELGETPLVIKDVPCGPHKATIEKTGYTAKTLEWNVENARPMLLKVELASNVGTLKIDSTPSGANLSIDGEPRGHTPFNERIEQGQHKVRVEKEGYAVYEQLVTVNRDKTTPLAPKLQLLPGSIKVTSTPSGASVYIGDKQYSNTPSTIKNLNPGTYKIVLEKAGYDKTSSEVTVRPGQNLEIEINLDSNTGGIDLIANPPGVSVYVDGRLAGVTEAESQKVANFSKVFPLRNLGVGTHTIMIAHRRAMPDKKTIEVEVKKGKIERLPVVTMWIANTTVKLRGGQVYTGRMVAETEEEILFEPEPGIRQTIKRSSIRSIIPLKED